MKIVILISTYNRAQSLVGLLKQIHQQRKNLSIEIVLANDGSEEDYSEVYSFLNSYFENSYTVIEYAHNHGKQKYYLLINDMFEVLKSIDFDYAYQLPDDVGLTNDFFTKSIDTFNSIPYKKKVCLNLLNDFTRKGPMWTNILPTEHSTYMQTGWVDMCYIANKHFFSALDYNICVAESFSSQKNKSSGVGMEISKKIINQGINLYQVKKSLVSHGLHKSVMHGAHRVENPLLSNHEYVTANVASMPSRLKSLEKVVASIINQVDELNVYLNEVEGIPSFLKKSKINVFKSQKCIGDLGDVGKFYPYSTWKEGYIFTIDDDIIYPPDYVYRMILGIERYQRAAAVTIHGRRLKQLPIESYYNSKCDTFRCIGNHSSDEFIHIPGTGVLAFHTSTISPSVSDFETINMADIWFGLLCQRLKVPVVMLAHTANWVIDSPYYNKNYSIYKFLHKSDSFQTQVVNENYWELHKCPLLQQN